MARSLSAEHRTRLLELARASIGEGLAGRGPLEPAVNEVAPELKEPRGAFVTVKVDGDLNGCIGFYGRPPRSEPHISKMKAPLLLLIAGADAATPLEKSQEFVRKLEAAGMPVESHVYEGAPHSFFDRGFEQWKDACDDAWRRILDFVKKHS